MFTEQNFLFYFFWFVGFEILLAPTGSHFNLKKPLSKDHRTTAIFMKSKTSTLDLFNKDPRGRC
jgi:hypothetical protein